MKIGYKDVDYINDSWHGPNQVKEIKSNLPLWKIILLVTACLAALIMLATLCIIFYNNNFSIESLISLLMAFFSIFISIFFYFKAADTSSQFYGTSYSFMKDVSVTLGKIEERFGEKLNSLDDKLSHLFIAKKEKTEELQTVEDEKEKLINELMDKAQLDEQQKQEYLNKLKEQEKEIMMLRKQISNIDAKTRNARIGKKNESDWLEQEVWDFSNWEISQMVHSPVSKWPDGVKWKAMDLGIIKGDEKFTSKGIDFFNYIMKQVPKNL